MHNHTDIHRGPGAEVQEALLRWLADQYGLSVTRLLSETRLAGVANIAYALLGRSALARERFYNDAKLSLKMPWRSLDRRISVAQGHFMAGPHGDLRRDGILQLNRRGIALILDVRQ